MSQYIIDCSVLTAKQIADNAEAIKALGERYEKNKTRAERGLAMANNEWLAAFDAAFFIDAELTAAGTIEPRVRNRRADETPGGLVVAALLWPTTAAAAQVKLAQAGFEGWKRAAIARDADMWRPDLTVVTHTARGHSLAARAEKGQVPAFGVQWQRRERAAFQMVVRRRWTRETCPPALLPWWEAGGWLLEA